MAKVMGSSSSAFRNAFRGNGVNDLRDAFLDTDTYKEIQATKRGVRSDTGDPRSSTLEATSASQVSQGVTVQGLSTPSRRAAKSDTMPRSRTSKKKGRNMSDDSDDEDDDESFINGVETPIIRREIPERASKSRVPQWSFEGVDGDSIESDSDATVDDDQSLGLSTFASRRIGDEIVAVPKSYYSQQYYSRALAGEFTSSDYGTNPFSSGDGIGQRIPSTPVATGKSTTFRTRSQVPADDGHSSVKSSTNRTSSSRELTGLSKSILFSKQAKTDTATDTKNKAKSKEASRLKVAPSKRVRLNTSSRAEMGTVHEAGGGHRLYDTGLGSPYE